MLLSRQQAHVVPTSLMCKASQHSKLEHFHWVTSPARRIDVPVDEGRNTELQSQVWINYFNRSICEISLPETALKFGLVSSFPEQIVYVILKPNLAWQESLRQNQLINFITRNICLTSLTRAKYGTRSTLCLKNPNISGSI